MLGIIIGVLVAAIAGPTIMSLLRRWAGRRRARRRVSPDLCEVCAKPATHEIRESFANDGELAGWPGGTSMSATYCKRHRPKGAVALRR